MASPRRRRIDERSAGGVVVRAVLRPDGSTGHDVALIRVGDAWSLPKGNLDGDETSEQAALREISEETGLPHGALRVIGELPAGEYAYRRRDTGRLVFKRVDHLLVAVDGDAPLTPQPGEVDEVAWVPLEEAGRTVTYRDLRAVLASARALLAQDGGLSGPRIGLE